MILPLANFRTFKVDGPRWPKGQYGTLSGSISAAQKEIGNIMNSSFLIIT